MHPVSKMQKLLCQSLFICRSFRGLWGWYKGLGISLGLLNVVKPKGQILKIIVLVCCTTFGPVGDTFGKIVHKLRIKTKPLSFSTRMSVLLDGFLFKLYSQLKCFHQNTEKTRDELREQVYDAMSEKKDSTEGETKVEKEDQEIEEGTKEEQKEDAAKNEEKENGEKSTEGVLKSEPQAAENVDAEQDVKRSEELSGSEEKAEPMEEEAGGRGVKYRAHGCRDEKIGLQ